MLFRDASFELEMNELTGWSRMMTDTWQASYPVQGLELDPAAGRVMLAKFWLRVPLNDFGR